MTFNLLRNTLLFLFLSISLLNCSDTYEQQIQQWKKERFELLKAPYGWPSVVGLFPIQNDTTHFGNADTNNIIIENGPPSFGYLSRTDKGIALSSGTESNDNGQLLRTDFHPDGPSYYTYKSIQWYIIEREGDYFLRVKDTLSPYRNALNSIPSYPIDKKYRIIGKIDETISPGSEITYKNILGMDITNEIAAVIKFQWKEKEYSLTATSSGEDSYMVMVHDRTTGIDTYGGGRYLYPKLADKKGVVILDFNKLENPPCVFTPFATCPLPPRSNHLPFEIEAGEKMLHLY